MPRDKIVHLASVKEYCDNKCRKQFVSRDILTLQEMFGNIALREKVARKIRFINTLLIRQQSTHKTEKLFDAISLTLQIVPSCSKQLKFDEDNKNMSRAAPAFPWKRKISYYSQQTPSLGTTDDETFSNEAGMIGF